MIEVRVFATLRQGRDKVTLLSPEGIACAGDILDRMNIPQEEVSILLINGFHHKPESEVKDWGHRGSVCPRWEAAERWIPDMRAMSPP